MGPMFPLPGRPVLPVGYTGAQTWPLWLFDDQRQFSGRNDVVTFETGVLDHAVVIAGQPKVHLMASTSGTDSAWVAAAERLGGVGAGNGSQASTSWIVVSQ